MMESVPPRMSAADQAALKTFNFGQMQTLQLLADHHPITEIMQSVCDLIESSMSGSRAITVRFLLDGNLAFVSNQTLSDSFRTAIEARLHDETSGACSNGERTCFEMTDTDHETRGRVLQGLIGGTLGALLVTRDWSIDTPKHASGMFDTAARLLQIGLEQQRAGQNLAATVAAEREQIANDLHDDPVQAMTVLSLVLQRLARSVPNELRNELDEARHRADEAIERMRRMLFELHPSSLEEEGLSVATEVYLEETMEPLGIEWSLDDRLDAAPDHTNAVLLFRLTHEALANVATHSHASTVSVELANQRQGVSITVRDDGRGFDPSTLPPHRPGHLGIANVEYVARRAGGRFDIQSEPGAGCTVKIWVPLDHAPSAQAAIHTAS